ncbi:MAG: hypothetical protein M1814_001348 [Vezdaea aestivalis]|nr:MAG: hypothetical protein M1814_001348 [Vezdaea aestivalis]
MSLLSHPLILDIQERPSTSTPSVPAPPSASTVSSKTGFPRPKRRHPSAFKEQHASAGRSETSKADLLSEKAQIDAENKARIARMKPEDIETERKELIDTLGSGLVERLLKRANIEEHREVNTAEVQEKSVKEKTKEVKDSERLKRKGKEEESKKVRFAPGDKHDTEKSSSTRENETSSTSPASASALPSSTPSVHFPKPPTAPSLDPSDPSFLTSLHETYFPTLPHDPSKLSWMKPPSDPSSSPYSPSLTSLAPSSLRYSFNGTLLPPKTSNDLPVTLGLHHHANAPDSAGYTISELAILARSTVAAQRCVAYQTLGRILYRLGKGEFGEQDEQLYEALWKVVEREKVLEMLMAEAQEGVEEGDGHRSARTHALEALWLWRRGGGRKVRAN